MRTRKPPVKPLKKIPLSPQRKALERVDAWLASIEDGAEDVTEPRKRIVVNPGDFGTKFLQRDNREIDQRKAKSYVKTWAEVSGESFITLEVTDKKGVYIIIDGQHRLFCACNFLGRPTQMKADFLPPFTTREARIRYVKDKNNSKDYTMNDGLHTERAVSSWPQDLSGALKDQGVDWKILYKGSHGHLQYLTLLNAVICADLSNKRGRLVNSRGRKKDIYELWANKKDSKVLEIADALIWYGRGFMDLPLKQRKSMRVLLGRQAFTLAVLAHQSLKNRAVFKFESRPLKLSELSLMDLRAAHSHGINAFANQWLKLLNYKCRDPNLITVFGLTGRN